MTSLSDLLAPLFLFWACGPLSVALGWVLDIGVWGVSLRWQWGFVGKERSKVVLGHARRGKGAFQGQCAVLLSRGLESV